MHSLSIYQQEGTTPNVDVVLTSITYFQRESSDDRAFLGRIKFDYLVVDEGHLLKNAHGLRYKNLDQFRMCHRLLLTGTPVQNSPQELMALLCFLMPLFSQKTGEFDEHDSDGGLSMLQHFVNLQEGNGGNKESTNEFAYRKLNQLFAPFVLRRRKKDVLSQIIPPKTYQVEMVELGDQARTIYNDVIASHIKAKKNKTNRASDHLFTALRKAAHHHSPFRRQCNC
ncbi:CHD3-type chromatin-remodeling factor [Seminavis robusta]|uniref:CHD3-type chromatin-remodeling factor n=1 Tax=Seminavis robusta TaxID=568900 RepID=A0A9N8HEG4_9STRA|nr:CHD3-type chromatin-remodeling factor [Seminavis robusta]|eukprot:Sro386_g131890.1 CHD3-type chromatin-remodeling factor (226) ;mRNA; f:38575-39344